MTISTPVVVVFFLVLFLLALAVDGKSKYAAIGAVFVVIGACLYFSGASTDDIAHFLGARR
jgi:hypothetical protein